MNERMARWECRPLSLFTWNCELTEAAGDAAELNFNWMTEQGTIRLNNDWFDVRKLGPFSGQWLLERDGQRITEAVKPDALFRRFEVRAGELLLQLEARSPFTRCYDISMSGQLVGSIEPLHPLTRQANIACDRDVPAPVQLMCVWLAVMTWRRAANNS